MSEQIITKYCPRCKQIKPLSEFHKNKSRKDGHSGHCKMCNKKAIQKYRQTEKGKISHRKTNKHYRQTEKGKIAQEKAGKYYEQTKKGKTCRIKAVKRYKTKYPERFKAVNAVNIAIKHGKIPRPNTLQCHYCPAQAKEYHHFSYAKECWLDVIPVCKKCHNLHKYFVLG